MSRRLVVIGAGAHAREIIEILRSDVVGGPREVVGVVADGHGDDELLARRGIERLGSISDAPSFGDEIVIAIGSSEARRRISASTPLPGAPAIVSGRSTVAASARLGGGSVVFPGVTINVDVVLEEHVHVNAHANVSHDCRLHAFVTIGPGVTLAGRITVGEGATIWTGATVVPGVTVGPGAVVGAGALVLDDVPPGAVVGGVPARSLKQS